MGVLANYVIKALMFELLINHLRILEALYFLVGNGSEVVSPKNSQLPFTPSELSNSSLLTLTSKIV